MTTNVYESNQNYLRPHYISNEKPATRCVELAREKFSIWKGQYVMYDRREKISSGNIVAGAYFRRGNLLVRELAVAHFNRKKPGFFARFFRTKAAREYAAERKQIESMVSDLKGMDKTGRWGCHTCSEVNYDLYLDRDFVLGNKEYHYPGAQGLNHNFESDLGFADKNREAQIFSGLDDFLANADFLALKEEKDLAAAAEAQEKIAQNDDGVTAVPKTLDDKTVHEQLSDEEWKKAEGQEKSNKKVVEEEVTDEIGDPDLVGEDEYNEELV